MYLNNKYTICYSNIIARAKSRASTRKTAKKLFGYVERHHIIPKSLGGLNSVSNLVYLTAKEHFICHLLLTKMLDGKAKYQMVKAAHLMTVSTTKHTRHKCSSRIYEMLKKEAAIAHSNLTKGKPKHTLASKEILSKKAKGRTSSFKNKTHKQSSKDLVSIAQSKSCISPDGEIFKSVKDAAQACNVSSQAIVGRIVRGTSGWKYFDPNDQADALSRKKQSKPLSICRGTKWWNNGTIQIRSIEKPGNEFVNGRL